MADIFQESEPIGGEQQDNYQDSNVDSPESQLRETPAAEQERMSNYQEGDAADDRRRAYRSQLLEKMQGTQPRWMEKGGLSETLTQTFDPIPIPDWDTTIKETLTSFPENTQTTEQTTEEAVDRTDRFSFQLLVGAIAEDGASVEILVTDGEVNDEFPSGMTGEDDYTITLSENGTEIWLDITYGEVSETDTHILQINSVSLNYGTSVPDITYSHLYIPIGFVDWDTDPDTGKITNVFPHNRQCGDVRLELMCGNYNGVPAVFPVRIYCAPAIIPLS